jgi:hypothetical protein
VTDDVRIAWEDAEVTPSFLDGQALVVPLEPTPSTDWREEFRKAAVLPGPFDAILQDVVIVENGTELRFGLTPGVDVRAFRDHMDRFVAETNRRVAETRSAEDAASARRGLRDDEAAAEAARLQEEFRRLERPDTPSPVDPFETLEGEI